MLFPLKDQISVWSFKNIRRRFYLNDGVMGGRVSIPVHRVSIIINKQMNRTWRILIEVGFIMFLFYANLLMGEFTRSNGQGKSLLAALQDIFTITNFVIAVIASIVGYVVFEYLRKKL